MNMPGMLANPLMNSHLINIGGINFVAPSPSFFGGNITIAVNNGSLSDDRLDDMCVRILTPYFHLKQDEYPPVDPSEVALNSFSPPPYVVDFTLGNVSNVDVRDNHAALIRELGAAGTVLLKNVNNALPLKKPKNIAVFGNDAGDVVDGLYFSGTPFSQRYGYGESDGCAILLID